MTQTASDTTPTLRRMFRLQWEPAQSSWVLLFPEGLVKLNPSASEILRRCDGVMTIEALVEELQVLFDTQDLHGEVVAFLAQARERGWLE
jgi:pyrroloquinoline quinone biosynthesis protein D